MLLSCQPDALAARIGRPGAPVLLDACTDGDFAPDRRSLPGKRRREARRVSQMAAVPRLDPAILAIGQKRPAARFRATGMAPGWLKGGVRAWAANATSAATADRPALLAIAGSEGRSMALRDGAVAALRTDRPR